MFFPIFAWPILGFGDAKYTDPVDPTSSMDPHNLNQQTFVQSSQATVAQQVMPDVMQQPLPQTTYQPQLSQVVVQPEVQSTNQIPIPAEQLAQPAQPSVEPPQPPSFV